MSLRGTATWRRNPGANEKCRDSSTVCKNVSTKQPLDEQLVNRAVARPGCTILRAGVTYVSLVTTVAGNPRPGSGCPEQRRRAGLAEVSMRPRSLDEFLAKARVPYTTFRHPPAFTAMRAAAVSHIPGRSWAKTVVCFADAEAILAVVPA